MTFNIEWGGAKISFDKVVEAIRRSSADIVGIQEAEGNLERLAGELGWHFDLRNYVISRFPLISPSGADGRYVFVEVEPGRIVAVANIHLPSDPYGPDAVRDGAGPDAVLEIEFATRMPVIRAYLESLAFPLAAGIPVFVTGDFNTPAHTDWTVATVGTRNFLKFPFEWPVTKALADAGFSDSWRMNFPDPVRNPGLTWWAARPPLAEYAPGENDARDRIDFIWFAGTVEALGSKLAGEAGGPEVSIGLSPWPSDHRAVVSRFKVEPAELPVLVSTGKWVYRGERDVDIQYNTTNQAHLSIIDADNNTTVFERTVPGGRSVWVVPSSALSPGHFRVVMQGAPDNLAIFSEFWVLPPEAEPQVEVTGSTFLQGEPISVRWRNAPGNRNDYLAVYPPGVPTGYDNGLAWFYTGAQPAGETRMDESTTAWGWPLEPGTWVVRLVKDDGYEVLAESRPFTVEPCSQPRADR